MPTMAQQLHAMAKLNEALLDMEAALDLIEEGQWNGDDSQHDEACPWCFKREHSYPGDPGGHALDCKAALLLRKYGRTVRFQGDP